MKVRKLLASLLSAAMVLGTMAFPAFAEDTDETATVIAIGATMNGCIAVDSNNKVYVWGNNYSGELGLDKVPTGIPNGASMLAVPTVHDAASQIGAVKVVGGDRTTLALTSDGDVYGWGRNNYGQTGNQTQNDSHPAKVEGVSNVVEIYAGSEHSMALTEDGQLYSWGLNDRWQLGRNNTGDTDHGYIFEPIAAKVNIPDGEKIVSASAAGGHMNFAVSESGDIYSWGENKFGALGTGDYSGDPVSAPTSIKDKFTLNDGEKIIDVESGKYSSYFITDQGNVYVLGFNWCGEIGSSTIPVVENKYSEVNCALNPVKMALPEDEKAIKVIPVATYGGFTLVYTESGKLYGTGDNSYLSISDSQDIKYTTTPIEIDLSDIDGSIADIVATASNVLVLTDAGKVYSWGGSQTGATLGRYVEGFTGIMNASEKVIGTNKTFQKGIVTIPTTNELTYKIYYEATGNYAGGANQYYDMYVNASSVEEANQVIAALKEVGGEDGVVYDNLAGGNGRFKRKVTIIYDSVRLNGSPVDGAGLQNAIDNAQDGDVITLLGNISGNGIVVPSGSNITIDLNGFTYNVDGTTVGSEGTETQAFQLLKNSNVTIKNGTITSTKASMLIQNYSNLTLENMTLDGSKLLGSSPYTLSNNYGNTVLKGDTNIIAKTGGYAFDCFYWPSNGYGEGVTVTLGEDFTGKITGKIEKTHDSTVTDAQAAEKSSINIAGGTFTTDVSDYVISGYYAKNNGDGTYTVLPAESKVIDTAKTTGATVTLDNLEKNSAVNPAEDATYKVVVSTAPTGDVEKANEAIKANNDTNKSKAIFDISVKKIDSYGVETDLGGNEDHSVKNQQVTLTLGETPMPGTVKVYHVDGNGVTTEINGVAVNGKDVTFTAPSFSTYAATYTAATLAEGNITGNIGVEFERIADTSSYNIVLKVRDDKTINRFMSTDLTFAMGVKEGTVGYAITPAANINLVDNGNGRYEFNLDGLTSSGATGTEITIGTVKFDGYGKIDFEVKTAATDDTNVVNTATLTDNIVDSYTIVGNGTTTGKLDLTNKLTDVEFKAPTKDLTVNVKFNNIVTNQVKAYQDMKVTISGGDLAAPITRELGSDGSDVTFASDTYTTTVADTLTQNITYTVTVSGAGYRTARYTVTMTADKTLNFWNNVKNNAEVVEVDNSGSMRNVTFLAGEIVKDNNINIYDLSAVVSYFGTNNNVNTSSAYAKYDLNRDGKIDSKDVAYVLVSWGK